MASMVIKPQQGSYSVMASRAIRLALGLGLFALAALCCLTMAPHTAMRTPMRTSAEAYERLTLRARGVIALPPAIMRRLTISESLDVTVSASDGANGDNFGVSVSLSGDGKYLAVGAPARSGAAGAAYVYTRGDLPDWSDATEVILTASNGASGDQFGYSVDISASGSHLVVGAFGRSSDRGAAYVYTRPPTGNWSVTAAEVMLSASNGANGDQFGYDVGISNEGAFVVVGAFGRSSGRGAAYIYAQPATGGWTTAAVETTLMASDGAAGDNFAASVDISGDGKTVIAGSVNRNSLTGGAYVYAQAAAGNWSSCAVETILTASNGATSDRYGLSVAISDDGLYIVIGAPNRGSLTGAVYVYTRPPCGVWTALATEAMLTASNGGVDNRFGYSVAINGNGTYVAVGAYYYNDASGRAYIYTQPGSGSWSPSAAEVVLTPDGSPVSTYFGWSVAISGDANTAAVGAWAFDFSKGIVYMRV